MKNCKNNQRERKFQFDKISFTKGNRIFQQSLTTIIRKIEGTIINLYLCMRKMKVSFHKDLFHKILFQMTLLNEKDLKKFACFLFLNKILCFESKWMILINLLNKSFKTRGQKLMRFSINSITNSKFLTSKIFNKSAFFSRSFKRH